MQAGYFVFYFVFPVFLEGCCMENHQRRNTGISFRHLHSWKTLFKCLYVYCHPIVSHIVQLIKWIRNLTPKCRTHHLSLGLQQNIAHEHYRAVEGEIFVMPCLKWDSEHVEVVWDRMGEGREENEHASFDCGSKFHAEAKYSGVYMCRTW